MFGAIDISVFGGEREYYKVNLPEQPQSKVAK